MITAGRAQRTIVRRLLRKATRFPISGDRRMRPMAPTANQTERRNLGEWRVPAACSAGSSRRRTSSGLRAVDCVTEPSRLRRIITCRVIVVRRGLCMRKPFERLFASKTVVAKLIELGYLNDMPILTNKTVRVALERLQTDLCRNATIRARIQRRDDDLRIEPR